MDIRPQHLGGATFLIALINVICVALPYWVHVQGQSEVGIFDSLRLDGDRWVQTKCDETYSETECGYLKSSQVSSIVCILVGFVASAIYFLPPRTFATLPTFLAVSGTCGQFVFSLMTTVIMHYFQKHYFDDDGINREDDSVDTTSYSWNYYVWIVTTVASFLVAALGYREIYKLRSEYKNAL